MNTISPLCLPTQPWTATVKGYSVSTHKFIVQVGHHHEVQAPRNAFHVSVPGGYTKWHEGDLVTDAGGVRKGVVAAVDIDGPLSKLFFRPRIASPWGHLQTSSQLDPTQGTPLPSSFSLSSQWGDWGGGESDSTAGRVRRLFLGRRHYPSPQVLRNALLAMGGSVVGGTGHPSPRSGCIPSIGFFTLQSTIPWLVLTVF